ncbi:hypothetical protein, partial [Rhodoplanes elegans]|uniref:hypothetical protein n=1 Tax=Rhodoplanes elegans TaxID=29408 RepID=UPI001A931C4E
MKQDHTGATPAAAGTVAVRLDAAGATLSARDGGPDRQPARRLHDDARTAAATRTVRAKRTHRTAETSGPASNDRRHCHGRAGRDPDAVAAAAAAAAAARHLGARTPGAAIAPGRGRRHIAGRRETVAAAAAAPLAIRAGRVGAVE